jgi:ankyrin repeat protein
VCLPLIAVADAISYDDVRNIARSDPLAMVKVGNFPMSASPGHLIAAVRHPNMAIVRCLFDFYPRMASTKDKDGDLPMHYAARYSRNIEMIRFLLQANPAATRHKGYTDLVPLQCAIYNEAEEIRHDIVASLLAVDPTAATTLNFDGDTALHLAVDNGCSQQILNLLIAAYPEALQTANESGFFPLHTACHMKRPDTGLTTETLLRAYPLAAQERDGKNLLPAHIAAAHSTVEAFVNVVNAHPEAISIVCDGFGTPLHYAVESSNLEMIDHICRRHPETTCIPDLQGHFPLHIAASSDNIGILRKLIEAYPEAISTPSMSEGRLPLHIFCTAFQDMLREDSPEADCLRFLVRSYPDAVGMTDKAGDTPLSLCPIEHTFQRRVLLRAMPMLGPDEFRLLNYIPRRMALFLAFAAINADGDPTIWCRIRTTNMSILKLTVSFL